MKEELITKGLDAFLTGAKVMGAETKVLIDEVLNYMLFSASLNLLKNLIWVGVLYGVYKALKALHSMIISGINQEREKVKNKIIKEFEEQKKKYSVKKEDNDKNFDYNFNHCYYHDETNLRVKIEQELKEYASPEPTHCLFYGIVLVISLWTVSKFVEDLRPIGKILTAPRLVLLQEGAHLVKSLKETVNK